MEKSAGLTLDLQVRISGFGAKKSDFLTVFRRTLKILLYPHLKGEIHLVLTDDDEIALINGLYRQKHHPTDVVSLSYFGSDEFPQSDLVGEIMISVETAERQARKQKHSLKKELQFLFVHGLLHVFGYDHEKEADRKKMFALQKKITN